MGDGSPHQDNTTAMVNFPPNSKEIPGYDGFYRADEEGKVWSCRMLVKRGKGKGRVGVSGRGPWKRMNSSPNERGYLSVGLKKDGKWVDRFVHRLVLEAFVGPCPSGEGARHFPDRDPSNNRLSNLQWATQKVNQRDRVFHGTDTPGEKSCRAKLTEEKVREIRAEYRERPKTYPRTVVWKHSATVLAKRYSVDPYTILNVVRRLTWKHVV